MVPLLKTDAVMEEERSVARGALAYVTNHEADAISLLGEADPSALGSRLAGQVAFARSVLETKRDAKAAVGLLDWARLLAPGGLVEEAALRREIALLAEAKDAGRMALLTRQYSTRFAASLYAPDFFHDLGEAIGRLGLADEQANYRLLSSAMATLPPDERREFLLTIARAAVIDARFEAASAAASDALRGAAPDSGDAARARLYRDAGRIFSDGYDAAFADLQGLAASRLDRSDAALLSSVRKVAAELQIATDAGAAYSQDASANNGGKGKDDGPTLTMERAQEALDRTLSLIGNPTGGWQ